jgi:hypothetical protein
LHRLISLVGRSRCAAEKNFKIVYNSQGAQFRVPLKQREVHHETG